jgi:hypothetical protein
VVRLRLRFAALTLFTLLFPVSAFAHLLKCT